MSEPSPRSPTIVRSERELDEVVRRLREARRFALDTEFVREKTFFIRLGIVQVATDELESIIDPYAIESLEPLFAVVADPDVEKIVHAGEQDFAVLFERSGRAPRNVFDTQVAAALVGLGDQISYGKLVEKLLGVRLSKAETLTDWTARPLTRAQIDYALEDVRYLPALRRHLGERLAELGREAWLREELRRLEDPATYTPLAPERYYERIKASGLDAVQLGVLREVAAWREQEAMRRDIPRGWVVRDPTLVEIARKKPTSMTALASIRHLKSKELERSGEALLAAVRRGMSAPAEKAPGRRRPSPPRERLEPLTRLLDAWLHHKAGEAHIAPSMLASRDDLRSLAAAHLAGETVRLAVLEGWRRELVGEDLLRLLAGRLRVRFDPRRKTLVGEGD